MVLHRRHDGVLCLCCASWAPCQADGSNSSGSGGEVTRHKRSQTTQTRGGGDDGRAERNAIIANAHAHARFI